MQAIVIDDRSFERAKHHEDFVRRMVFPGGCIPSVASITASLARATDLRVVDLEDIGRHYAETLRRWRDNLECNAAAVEATRAGTGVPPALGAVPGLLRGVLPGAPRERRATRPGQTRAPPTNRSRWHLTWPDRSAPPGRVDGSDHTYQLSPRRPVK